MLGALLLANLYFSYCLLDVGCIDYIDAKAVVGYSFVLSASNKACNLYLDSFPLLNALLWFPCVSQ